MSRIGKKPIAIPKGVKVDTQPGVVEIQGPKGKLRQPLPAGIGFEVEGDQLHARTLREDPELGKFHGLARSLVANAVRGGGSTSQVPSMRCGHRARNGHRAAASLDECGGSPTGSPGSGSATRASSSQPGRISGTDATSSPVYGWNGGARIASRLPDSTTCPL